VARRVVITGLGLLTPVGEGLDATWEALVAGKSGAAPIRGFDASTQATTFACQLDGFDPGRFIGPRLARTLDPFVQYALAASALALEDAGIAAEQPNEQQAERFGVYVGSGLGGVQAIDDACQALSTHGPRRVSPYFVPAAIINLAAGQIAIRHGLRGPNLAPVSACASGAHAIGEAFHVIRRGDADAMLAGAAEAAVTPLGLAGFGAMKALSRRNGEPERASRPFDRERDGFVLAEGAGIIVLEAAERAEQRGARIYAELRGYGLNADAHHITQPRPGGEGAARCIAHALASAGLSAADVDHVNAHGTGTGYNDVCETQAIKSALGPRAREITITANKSMIGHLLGASGSVEVALTALTLARGVVPPTINLDNPDPACDLDYVPHCAREARVEIALCNSFGFGGANACLALSRHGAASAHVRSVAR